MLIPFGQILVMNQIIGGDPTDLSIAIVNQDSSYQDCGKTPSQFDRVSNDSCYLKHISCRFINEIDDVNFKTFFYKSSEDAMKDVIKLKTAAILTFDRNFSNATNVLNNYLEEDEEIDGSFTDSGNIQVQLDFTDLRIAYFIKHKIYSAYKNFAGKMMETCGLSKSLKNLPVKIDLVNNVNTKDFQLPGVFIL
jgi:hypothetical protein